MTDQTEKLKERLRQIFLQMHADDHSLDKEKACHDFVFHMTDWMNDLRQLANFYANPAETTDTDARDAVTGLLYHASAHINEAARLYDFLPEPFDGKR